MKVAQDGNGAFRVVDDVQQQPPSLSEQMVKDDMEPQPERPKSSFWANVGWTIAGITAWRLVGVVGVLIIAAAWWAARRIIKWYRAPAQPSQAAAAAKAEPQRRPLADLGFMVVPALLIAMFVTVWVAADFLYAVAALVAVVLLYKPVSVLVVGALLWWSERRS
jgi:hypothetical protein